MPVLKKTDVVAVGAGWTAAILAWKLTEAGLDFVSIEQGPVRWTYPDFAHNHDELRYGVRKQMMVDLSRVSWTWRPNDDLPALPMRTYGAFHPGQGLGGSAPHWSGMLYRYVDTDFKIRSHTEERYGADRIPEDMTIQDWPLTYAEMAPYYDQFEQDIGVSGQVGNLNGELIEGGNPFVEHSRPYPLPPLTRTIPSLRFEEAARSLGYHPFPQPSGIRSEAFVDRWGNRSAGCLYCGFCTRYGCEVDAKSSPLNAHIPAALNTGRYRIIARSHVTEIMLDADGRATGLKFVTGDGTEYEQPADIVILSGYPLGNVGLLLNSGNGAHPDGVGNSRGQVGRNLTHQMWLTTATGVFEGKRFNMYTGNTSTQTTMMDLYGDIFDHSDLDFIDGASMFCGAGERTPAMSAGSLPVQGDQKWGRPWKEALRTEWDSYVPINMQGSMMAYRQNRFDLDPRYRDHWGKPLLRLTMEWGENEEAMFPFMVERAAEIMREMNPTRMEVEDELDDYNIHDYKSTHINGGAVMGDDPSTSVTNKYGQVWDVPNLFVTGATLFPQNPGGNPTNTVAALAYMTGDAIRDRYLEEQGRLMA